MQSNTDWNWSEMSQWLHLGLSNAFSPFFLSHESIFPPTQAYNFAFAFVAWSSLQYYNYRYTFLREWTVDGSDYKGLNLWPFGVIKGFVDIAQKKSRHVRYETWDKCINNFWMLWLNDEASKRLQGTILLHNLTNRIPM